MKHLLFFVLLLGLALPTWAQSANPLVWCPTGATWTYAYTLFRLSGTVTVHYERDTVVAGQKAQLLTRQLVTYDQDYPNTYSASSTLSSVVTRTVADRVEVLANGRFYTLYDFSAQLGSTWLTPRVVPTGPCPAEVVLVTVDSIGTQLVGGRQLRWFRARLTTPTGNAVVGNWPGRIYEQLGNLQYMQPQSPGCAGTDPGYMGPFISYRATGWPTIGYNPAAGTLLATAQGRAVAVGFTVFPNPSTGLFTLQLPVALASTGTVHVLDAAGRTIRQLSASANRQMDMRGLPSGVYTLLLFNPGQPPMAQRLLVQ
jgi:hypothetical protein